MSEKKQPWAKWFWGDWRKDARLRRCCYAARGLWADMLSLMGGETDRFGYLIMEGQALGPSDLVGLLGGAEREVKKLLVELEAKRVFSRTGDAGMEDDLKAIVSDDIAAGVIFSRRMLRDKAKAELDRENGKTGGNPNLNPTRGGRHNGGVNPPDKAQILELDSNVRKDSSVEAKASTGGASAKLVLVSDKPDWWPQRDRFGRVLGDVTDKLLFDVGKAVLGSSSGGQIAKLKKLRPYNRDWRAAVELLLRADDTSGPGAWFARALKNAERDEPETPMHEVYPEGEYRA
jgi:hypothetical protein